MAISADAPLLNYVATAAGGESSTTKANCHDPRFGSGAGRFWQSSSASKVGLEIVDPLNNQLSKDDRNVNLPRASALRFSNHSDIEKLAGYSRAARYENVIAVSGTTADLADGRALLGDTYEQSIVALKRALSAVSELGGAHDSVVRTRMLLAPGADWKAASMAHHELLGDVAPANSMYYVHSLIGDGYLVEVEIDAVAINEPLAQNQPR